MESSFMDDIDCSNFFDQIDDLIEFPPDNGSGGNLVSSEDSKDFPSMWSDALPESDPLFSANAASDLSAELSVPYEDIMQLEWLSSFVEDSFSGQGLTLGKESLCSSNQFQISSPISVLESSTSSSSTSSADIKTAPLSPTPHRGARSKRPRPTTFSPRPSIPTFIDTPGFEKILEPSGTEQKKKKRRKIKKTSPHDQDSPPNPNPSTEAVRKCMHCEITKTPQWRAGPMGPKSLCNACGVRYKSGRLFPEYRPAASPTFVPALHSNSHKKVIEMRTKTVPEAEATPLAIANSEIVPKVE